MNDYKISVGRDVDPEAVRQLRLAAGWQPDTYEVWSQTIKEAIAVASAWQDSQLIGVGFVVGSSRHGVLSDLVVSPDYRKHGVGRAVAEALLETTRNEGVRYVTLTYAEETPWLKDFYQSLGFESVQNAMQFTDKG